MIRPASDITVARVHATEILFNCRWLPVMALGTWLLAQNVLPARFPAWEFSTDVDYECGGGACERGRTVTA